MATVKWRTMGNNKRRAGRGDPYCSLAQLFPSTTRKKMAALIRHGSLASSLKSTSALLAPSTASARCDITRTKVKIVPKQYPNLDATRQSLAAKGFQRSQKSYTPPSNATSIIEEVCRRNGLSLEDGTKIEDNELRYHVFSQVGDSFNHYIPNSIMHAVETIGDLKNFYCESVDTVTPLDAMRRMELPKNLHIQHEYLRFHPETDEMFGGKTAFPQSSTLVTGLKYRKKYRGHSQKNPWHHLQKTV